MIWWMLTNIIPMRASEFCLIQRDCLVPKDGATYIRLPRTKKSKGIQVYDKVKVTSKILEIITEYLSLSEQFGETKTLISYRAILGAQKSIDNYWVFRELQKKNADFFTLNILKNLIPRFYTEILPLYEVYIERDKWVRPNDTRHIAFISLMMQGVSPIEIARLGGHSTVEAQYHYSNHVEYWIDSEVDKLMKKYAHFRSEDEHSDEAFIPKEVTLRAFQPGTTNAELPLKLGHCSDHDQRCETDNMDISGCIFECSHWRIHPVEFIEQKQSIKALASSRKNRIHELYAFMNSLHEKILKSELTRKNPISHTQLKTTSNQIHHEVASLARFGANPFDGGRLLEYAQ
jgi:hypothetical protein